MKFTFSRSNLGVFIFALMLGVVINGRAQSESGQPWVLWYAAPASLTNWTAALPIGNGRLGAMVFGGVERERIQLNEDTLWSGGPYDPVNTNALPALPEVRRLIFAGQYAGAQKLAGQTMLGNPPRQMAYETVGDLFLSFPTNGPVTDYRRELDLDTAIARTTYTSGGVKYTREMFSSAVDQVIVVRLTADTPGKISFTAGMATPQDATVKTDGDVLIMNGTNGSGNGVKGALKFQARVSVLAKGGKVSAAPDSLSVSNADSVTLLIAVATSYKNYHDVSGKPEAIVKKQIRAATRKSFDVLRSAHVADYQELFHRVDLNLGESDSMKLPTGERIKHFDDDNDPQLAALYFQFARYLLISSSRPGSQPANLQGLWNESMNPPWNSKFTININTEMNYWPAGVGNLAECEEPLAAMVQDLAKTGAQTARVMYGARGWVAHHNTDLWRATAPIDGPQYGIWPTGGAWLCNTLWDNYEFTGNSNSLKQIYPLMKGAAQFFLDTLVEEPTHHWLVTSPSLSPENKHPQGASITDGPTMDEEILRDLFTNCISAAEILGVDKKFRGQLADASARLAPLQIGKAGQLQEWLEDWDMEAPDIHHRHVSHLYGLFPSDQIDFYNTPELADAAKKSLEIRGDESTGWATAWRVNLWARLHNGSHAYKILSFLISPQRTYPDLFDAHPPFQIDGNFGGASGIAEMLLQSQGGEIEFLPALPPEWPDGSVTGFRARGDFEVSFEWKGGVLTSATIHSLAGNPCLIHYGNIVRTMEIRKGETLHFNGNLQ
ncbi:MAG TPA: glycoside hydrolase family 95 protein [Verrucomicrobiae bacterium]|jgi:alpha-L-fucosidase 2